MNQQQEQLDAIRDIRNLMERSSRFSSLSGLAGIIVGVFAISATVAAYLLLGIAPFEPGYVTLLNNESPITGYTIFTLLAVDFGSVLVLSLITGIYLSVRKAGKQNLPVWDATAKRMLVNFFIPLVTGGIYCLILLQQGQAALVLPATLIFYGLALLHASKYTINDIRYLGVLEVVLGLAASYFTDHGLLFWAAGFGMLHIVYGTRIYFKYEQ